jgi:hypothetical protein
VRLIQIAHARSGDKGDTVNVGVIARRPEWYPLLAELLTVLSLMTDAQGKTFSSAMLRMEVDVPDDVAAEVAP